MIQITFVVPMPVLIFIITVSLVSALDTKHVRFVNLSLDTNSEFEQYMRAIKQGKISFPNAKLLPVIDSRNDLPKLLNDEEKTRGAEVSVQEGYFSKTMLNGWTKCQKYYLIDPWENQKVYHDDENVNLEEQLQQRLMQIKENVKNWDHKVEILESAHSIPNIQLDFVYIDARNDYKAVWQDLESYWPKLKQGGILAGSDFFNANEEPKKVAHVWCVFPDETRCPSNNSRSVKAAVEEFARKVNRQIVVTRRETVWVTWYMRK